MRTLAGIKNSCLKRDPGPHLFKTGNRRSKGTKTNEGQRIDDFEYVKFLIIIYQTYVKHKTLGFQK